MALLLYRRVHSVSSFLSGFRRPYVVGLSSSRLTCSNSSDQLLGEQQLSSFGSNQDEVKAAEENLLAFQSMHLTGETIGFKSEGTRQLAMSIQELLNSLRGCSVKEIEKSLERFSFPLTDELVIAVINRHVADWRPAYTFFKWASGKSGYLPGSAVYNEILDTLGKMNRFEEVEHVLKQMSGRQGLFDEGTYGVLLKRFAAAHKVKETIDVFHKRREFGLEMDLAAFQSLLMWLCRHKHVEEAEALFNSLKDYFGISIKTMNIVLSGWCVLGDVREAKRFWKNIVASDRVPDRYTYGTFIKALTKKGKLGSAMKLFREMSENGSDLDVVSCNCVIDALCFKKRIPEALEVFESMKERGCFPNVITYNSLIKHMCKIQRMEKVEELVNEMSSIGGNCSPNSITYGYLLRCSKEPEDVSRLLERMAKHGCELTDDLYNLILRLYMDWGCENAVRQTWEEMERNGVGPDGRSFTIMIHGLYDQGKVENALHYFDIMVSRGIVPEPRTEILVNDMRSKMKEGEDEITNKKSMTETDPRRHLRTRRSRINSH